MKKILCFFPGLALVLALAGCCANDVCVCQDEQADALSFQFKIGSGPNDFQAVEVDTLFIVRVSRPTATVTTITRDSVLRTLPINAGGSLVENTSNIAINNTAPFSLSGGNTKLNAYDYLINTYQVTAAGGIRTTKRTSFKINNIQLDGRYNANGCCTCYENTNKQFDFSGKSFVGTTDLRTTPASTTGVAGRATATQTAVVTAPALQPIITYLSKP